MPKNVYIHIPFCKGKCKYCSFISYNKPEFLTGYIYSLLKEITENYRGEQINTLYLGGGTPSLVPADLIKKIIKKFNYSNGCEITLEINPDDSSLNYLKQLNDIGINRLSIGSQTFDNDILRIIGRRHNSDQIYNTVTDAKKAGFKNISLDFIYGLPNQTITKIESDIKNFLNLDIQHISTYGLKIEEESIWGKNPPDNIPNDDMQADMYEIINSYLEKNEFKRYEISNFAKAGYESRHNLNYWNNSEYYGFGVAAHGYIDGVRYYNTSNLENYINNPVKHEYGHFLTEQERLEEDIFLGFRKTTGINISEINNKYTIDFNKKYKNVLAKYKDYLVKTENGYALNIKGILVSNLILAEFL